MADRNNPGASGSDKATVEVKARTVDEAIARGLVRLGGLSRSEVKIEIVNEGKAGLLGFGSEEAVVHLTPLGQEGAPSVAAPSARSDSDSDSGSGDAPRKRRRRRRRRREDTGATTSSEQAEAPAVAEEPTAVEAPPQEPVAPRRAEPAAAVEAPREQPRRQPERSAPAPASDASEEEVLSIAQDIVQGLLQQLGYEDVRVDTEGGLLPTSLQEEDSSVLCIRGEGTERLLSREGESLRALQFLTRLMVSRRTEAWTNLLLDVDGDRRRQIKELLALSEQSADLVESGGRPVSLPPMGAYERRVVHIALKDHPTIATQSIGSGDRRKVTVRRKDQLLPDMSG